MFQRLAFLCLTMLLIGVGCSTNGGNGDGQDDGGLDAGDDGDRPMRPTPMRGDSGTIGDDPPLPGEGVEGDPCESVADCAADLACIDSGRFTVGFCARPCESDDDCGSERCFSYTNLAADAHCVNLEREEFGDCGEAYTALCASERTCLTFPSAPVGICVDICALDGSPDAGMVDSDAGVETSTCAATQSCVDGVLADATRGVCGTIVERGEECGIDIGLFCEATDICTRADPEDAEEVPVCRQDCSNRQTCEEGTTCTDFRGEFAYCL